MLNNYDGVLREAHRRPPQPEVPSWKRSATDTANGIYSHRDDAMNCDRVVCDPRRKRRELSPLGAQEFASRHTRRHIIIRGINPRGARQPRFPRVRSSFSGLRAVGSARADARQPVLKSLKAPNVYIPYSCFIRAERANAGQSCVFSRALNLRRRGGEN